MHLSLSPSLFFSFHRFYGFSMYNHIHEICSRYFRMGRQYQKQMLLETQTGFSACFCKCSIWRIRKKSSISKKMFGNYSTDYNTVSLPVEILRKSRNSTHCTNENKMKERTQKHWYDKKKQKIIHDKTCTLRVYAVFEGDSSSCIMCASCIYWQAISEVDVLCFPVVCLFVLSCFF